jgi:hypothetical protein
VQLDQTETDKIPKNNVCLEKVQRNMLDGSGELVQLDQTEMDKIPKTNVCLEKVQRNMFDGSRELLQNKMRLDTLDDYKVDKTFRILRHFVF